MSITSHQSRPSSKKILLPMRTLRAGSTITSQMFSSLFSSRRRKTSIFAFVFSFRPKSRAGNTFVSFTTRQSPFLKNWVISENFIPLIVSSDRLTNHQPRSIARVGGVPCYQVPGKRIPEVGEFHTTYTPHNDTQHPHVPQLRDVRAGNTDGYFFRLDFAGAAFLAFALALPFAGASARAARAAARRAIGTRNGEQLT